MAPTTKKWKMTKLKSNRLICTEVSVNSLGKPGRKGRIRSEGFAEKDGFKRAVKE